VRGRVEKRVISGIVSKGQADVSADPGNTRINVPVGRITDSSARARRAGQQRVDKTGRKSMLKNQKIHEGKGIKSSIVIDSNVIIDTFDPQSPNYEASMSFMNHIIGNRILFAMPMHGWFEINCTLNRMRKEGLVLPPIISGAQQMMVEFIHIDAQFLENYASVEDIPVIKAMDHLFLVVAKKNKLPLITWDRQVIAAGEECGVDAVNPADWMQQR
jgi:predicted nucleic acid-binding protein